MSPDDPRDLLRGLRDDDRWTGVRVPRARGGAATRSATTRARLVPAIAAFVIAILAVAGIAVGLGSLHPAAAPADTPTPTPTASATGGAILGVSPDGAAHHYTAATPPSPCTLTQLQTESKQNGGGAAGTYFQQVFVHNAGTDCDLAGDAVRVGGAVATIQSPPAAMGIVLPTGSSATLSVATAEACQPTGRESNIDPTKPVLAITLHTSGGSRTMTARYPLSRCTQPIVQAELDPDASAHFTAPIPELTVQVDLPPTTAAGPITYPVTIENTGAKAVVLQSCPTATEVLEGTDGAIVTRRLALRCVIGARIESDQQIALMVTTTLPTKGGWNIAWFLSGGAATTAASTTCLLSQLHFTEPHPPGGSTGDVVQLIEIRNSGATCLIPPSAFAVSGRTMQANTVKDRSGIALAAGRTTSVVVLVTDTCPDGSMNVTSFRSFGPDDKPIAVTLGSQFLALPEPFPELHCANPVYLERR